MKLVDQQKYVVLENISFDMRSKSQQDFDTIKCIQTPLQQCLNKHTQILGIHMGIKEHYIMVKQSLKGSSDAKFTFIFAYKCVFAVCGHNHHKMKKIHSLLFFNPQK